MKKFLLIFLTFWTASIYSQSNSKIDSLRNELKKNKNDKFLDYVEITNAFTLIGEVDSVFYYTARASDEVKKSNKTIYFAKSYILQTNVYFLKQDWKNAFATSEKALQYSLLSKDESSIFSSYFLLGKITYTNIESKKNIFYAKKALESFERLKNKSERAKNNVALNYVFLIESYNNLGNYREAKNYLIKLKKHVALYQLKNRENTIIHVECKILESLGDLKQAIVLRSKNVEIIKKLEKKVERVGRLCEEYYNLAELNAKNNDLLSAKKYLDSSKIYLDQHKNKESLLGYYKTLESDISLKEGKLSHYAVNQSINYSSNRNDLKNVPLSFIKQAELYEKEKNNKKAIDSYNRARRMYGKDSLNLQYSETLVRLIKLYIKNNDSINGLKLFDEFLISREKLFNEQVAKSLSTADVKYETELKESQIKSQQLELQTEKTNKYIAFGGAALLLLLTSGGYFWFRNKEKRDKLETQNALLSLQFDLNKMELQSLNKQLDPHEIKNLLSSISPEIQEKAPESYRKMLKLLNITKASLNNSSMTESVKNQVQQIEDFLSLEKNSLSVPFEYSIQNNIETKGAQIPRLMLKNLVENAIKHGIKRNENGGNVNVILTEENQLFKIIVDDTGKGRKLDTISDTGIGTSTYKNLFATLNKKNIEAATFEIIDKKQGTRVQVKIPTNYKYE